MRMILKKICYYVIVSLKVLAVASVSLRRRAIVSLKSSCVPTVASEQSSSDSVFTKILHILFVDRNENVVPLHRQ